MLDSVRDMISPGEASPNSYRCSECGRSFDVDAPPERVICSDCGNEDVDLLEA